MSFKKILCAILSVIMLLAFAGCKEKGEDISDGLPEESEIGEALSSRNYLTLLYSASDTFNPYSLKTDVNRQLCKLLYEPLVKLDNRFEPINALASSVKVEGTSCKVTLKTVNFSDGSKLTAKDVIYSFNLAKNSATSYGQKLYEVTSVSADGDAVVFSLTKNDPYFANVLDFPIIKKDSDTKTDSDSVSLPPVGCGKYKLNDTKDGLLINEFYFDKIQNIKEIRLINAPDDESVAHYTEIGAADMYFTENSDGSITRMSGKRLEVNLNNLVYLGINQNYAPLGEQALRQALSSALNRVRICEKAYYNNALPATGFFHPHWKEASSVQNIQIETNTEITIENLEEIGYNKLNGEGQRVNSNGIPLKFTLLVNTENRIKVLAANTVAQQLKSAGIGINVVEKSYEQYISDLKNGNFQLYLGEIKLTDNMDASALFLKDGTAAFGIPKTAEDTSEEEKTDKEGEPSASRSTASQSVLDEFYKGNATIKDVASVLQTEMAVVPICYRTGVLFYNKDIENMKNSSLSDIYFSINSYLINERVG